LGLPSPSVNFALAIADCLREFLVESAECVIDDVWVQDTTLEASDELVLERSARDEQTI
jgi:hypothetical protein